MITIKKFSIELDNGDLYDFEPITFTKGINLIVGERSSENSELDQKEKMNSVGKSLLIEMINFCLLKESASSRVDKVPYDVLQKSLFLCLALEYESEKELKNILIRRSRDEKNPIQIVVDGEIAEFSSKEVSKAIEYLGHYFMEGIEEKPTLRKLISILIRDEKIGFDNILLPNGKAQMSDYASVITPHAYLFRLSLERIKAINKLNKNLEKAKTVSADSKAKILSEGVKIGEIRSYMNELDREVQKLDVAADSMRPSEGASQLIDELNRLSQELESLVTQKSAKVSLSRKIKSIPYKNRDIKPRDLSTIYEKYRQGLGDLVARTFNETLEFRSQVDEFEQELLTEKLSSLVEEISHLTARINELDDQIKTIYDSIGYTERVTDFRITLQEQAKSQQKLGRLRQVYDRYEDKEKEKKSLQRERETLIDVIETSLAEMNESVNTFEEDLITIHEAIYGNAQCQFKIEINPKAPKQYLIFNYRTYLDGGASSDRIKTFMYDALLMLNSYTQMRHPRFLIHDNVFAAVGRNDMVNSLNFLEEEFKRGASFQYIVTINKDEFEAQEEQFKFKTKEKIRIVLTRENQLLGQKYAEL